MAKAENIHIKYTPETVAVLEEAILMGANIDTAADAAGINRATFYKWQNAIPEFADRMRRAKAMRQVNWLKVIEAAQVEHWQAAAWKLERTDPKQFGRRVAMQMIDENGDDLDPQRVRDTIATRLAEIAESEAASIPE